MIGYCSHFQDSKTPVETIFIPASITIRHKILPAGRKIYTLESMYWLRSFVVKRQTQRD